MRAYELLLHPSRLLPPPLVGSGRFNSVEVLAPLKLVQVVNHGTAAVPLSVGSLR